MFIWMLFSKVCSSTLKFCFSSYPSSFIFTRGVHIFLGLKLKILYRFFFNIYDGISEKLSKTKFFLSIETFSLFISWLDFNMTLQHKTEKNDWNNTEKRQIASRILTASLSIIVTS